MVSRTFQAIFEPLIYSSFVFIDGEVKYEIAQLKTDIRPTSLLLQCLTTRPDLRNHAQCFVLVLGSGANDDKIAGILNLLPNISRFDLWGGKGNEYWTGLSVATKTAITTACQRSSLRSPCLTGFLALPSSLLRTSNRIYNLSVSSVPLFTEGEPHREVVHNFRAELEPSIPTSHFSSLCGIECAYAPTIARHRWLETAIESSSASGSLRKLALAATVAPIFERQSFEFHPFPSFQRATN
jgi:hypothetical protein